MSSEITSARRLRMRAAIGPHKQVSKVRVVEAPAQPGVAAHRDHLVDTACGREITTTLTTLRDDLVRCPNCLAAAPQTPETAPEETR